jgi:hypothetical protein
MSHHEHSDERSPEKEGWLTSRSGLVLLGFLVIAGALLFTEHRAHVLGASLWLLLLACPLMHMFMHGGHGGHGSSDANDSRSSGSDPQPGTHQH